MVSNGYLNWPKYLIFTSLRLQTATALDFEQWQLPCVKVCKTAFTPGAFWENTTLFPPLRCEGLFLWLSYQLNLFTGKAPTRLKTAPAGGNRNNSCFAIKCIFLGKRHANITGSNKEVWLSKQWYCLEQVNSPFLTFTNSKYMIGIKIVRII